MTICIYIERDISKKEKQSLQLHAVIVLFESIMTVSEYPGSLKKQKGKKKKY